MIGVSYHLKIIQSFANNNIKKTCETSWFKEKPVFS